MIVLIIIRTFDIRFIGYSLMISNFANFHNKKKKIKSNKFRSKFKIYLRLNSKVFDLEFKFKFSTSVLLF